MALGYDAGRVSFFAFSPSTAGWAQCDGSGAVMSMPDGSYYLHHHA